MTFDEILAQVLDLLQREKRLSYRALKVRFGLDDEHLAALKDEIIEAKQLAVDDRGVVLVWTGDGAPAPPATASTPVRASLATMPAYLAEKIRTTRDTLAGERKQVTVRFADIKDSTELIRGLDPEVAQRLLDPALQHMMDAVHRFEGTVNQVLGDGIMALFGAPIAHEDHALRACYAALAMQTAMRAYTDTEAMAQASAGHGQVVALVGEAGVGKSRLVYECVHSYRTQGWLVLESASVSYGKATPYFPVIDLLKRYCHIEERDDSRTIRAKVTGQVLTLDATLQDTVPALLALLDALPDNYPFLRLDPPQRRQRTLEALARVLPRASQVQPLLLVFEDLHWIDTETQALLDRLVDILPTARLLLLVNDRPEYQHGWASKIYYAQLRLDPLPPASAEELLAALLGDDSSIQPLTRLLIARTEGNPFFLEESVRALVEAEVLVGTLGAYRLAQALPTIQVPATVQAVLAARIDRLPADAKHLLQTAAVIGHEVPLILLQAVADLAEGVLHRSLAQRQGAEFLYETRLFPEWEYTFKHALTHEVAYGSLLQERRRVLHARIVNALEGLYADRLAEQVDRLAHHALRGEVWNKALVYCRQAGEKTMVRSAYREAVGAFQQALHALQRLPEGRDTIEQAIDLRLDMRNALLALGDVRAMFDALREAETLARAIDDHRRLGRVSFYMIEYFRMVGDYDRAIASGQQALALAESLSDFGTQVVTNAFLGNVYYARGDQHRAIEVLQKVVTALTGDLTREHFGLMGFQAWALRLLGEIASQSDPPEIESAEIYYRQALTLAEELGMRPLQAHGHYSLGTLYLTLGQREQARAALSTAIDLYRAMEMTFWLPQAEAMLAQVKD